MAQSKPQWFVSVFGNEDELTRLHNFLDSPNCYLERLENKICYLTSCRFSNFEDFKEDLEEVYDLAQKLVAMIKAFAKLEFGGEFQSVHIGSGKIVVESKNVASVIQRVDGSQSVGVYLIPVGATATAIQPRVTSAELVEPPKREKRIHDDYLNRCDEEIDGNIYDALYFFAEETSFYSLYKVYETIKMDTDGHMKMDPKNCKMVNDCWVSYIDLKAFRRSANCHGVVRSSEDKYRLRHSPAYCGQGKYQGPFFDLAQAECFIKRLLEKWLSWKERPKAP
jgi:hypothetical protein